MNTRRTTAALTLAALLAITGCSSSDTPAPAVTVTTASEPTPAATDMTAAVVALSWEQQSEADKDAMCQSIALYGPGWAAQQMELGAATDIDGVDWDRAAELVAQKCATR